MPKNRLDTIPYSVLWDDPARAEVGPDDPVWPLPALPSPGFCACERACRGYLPGERQCRCPRCPAGCQASAALGRSCSFSRTEELSCWGFLGFGSFLMPSLRAHGANQLFPVFPTEAVAARSRPSAPRVPQRFQRHRSLVLPPSARAEGTGACARSRCPCQQGGRLSVGAQERNGFAGWEGNGLPHCPSCSQTWRPFVAEQVGVSQVKSPPVSLGARCAQWQMGVCEKVRLTVE